MKKLSALITLFALLAAFGCSDNQLVGPRNSDAASASLAKANKVTILNFTDNSMLYGVRAMNGTRVVLWPVDYGHLIEVSENALKAHLAHGDVIAKDVYQLHGGEYIRACDKPDNRLEGDFVFITV